jgi:hypothetical protein
LVVVVAALVALTFAPSSLLRPQTASAQCNGNYSGGTYYNGTYDPYNMGCSYSGGNFCNGYTTGVVNGTSCSAAYGCNGSTNSFSNSCSTAFESNCNGSNYITNAQCSTAYGSNCNGSNYIANAQCSTAYGSNCNGSNYIANTQCSTAYGSYCNGITSTSVYGTNCSTEAAYTCNGVSYNSPVSCSTTASTYTCNGVGYSYNVTCPTNYTDCAGGGQVVTGQQCPAITVASTYPAVTNSSYAFTQQGFSVSYAPGWNIVAGPSGSTITGNVGSFYSFRPGDTTYEVAPAGSALTAGVGAWAYFTARTNTTIGMANPGNMSVQLPPGQFVMIGNSGDTAATVSGADSVLVYNPSNGGYSQTTQLAAGQGAWAISMNGGMATMTNAPV